MSKRFITSALVILFLVRIIGYFPFFKIEQWTIRREIKTMLKKAIPDAELEVFSYPVGSTEAKKYGEKDEFELHGEMYDVVRKKIEAGILKLYCIHDNKETGLFNRLDRTVRDRMNSTHHPFRNVINIFQKIFHSIEPVNEMLSLSRSRGQNSHIFGYLNTYSFDFIRKLAPPPRFVF